MNVQPVNGLHLLAVELGLLAGFWAMAWLVLRLVPASLRSARPAWLEWCLAAEHRAVLLVIVAAIGGRALLLPVTGIPAPRINDEYSYLMMADTFAHGRISNPTPPAWQHFETFHVNMAPTYHSKYPVAQGVMLAFGQVLFGQPWIGIVLSTALLCGAICWALQAFVPPGWAFLGGLLAVVRLATFSYWMNSYWGGSVAALGGALALGSAVRIFDRDHSRRAQMSYACVFAFAMTVLATSRPYEGLAFSLPLLLYFGWQTAKMSNHAGSRQAGTLVLPLVVAAFLGIGFMAYYDHETTGHAAVMPYAHYENTYATLPVFIGQKITADGKSTDPVFTKYYAVEAEEHNYEDTKSLSGLMELELERVASDWFFYVGPALSFPVLLGLLSSLKQARLRLAVYAALTAAIAVAMCVFAQQHYFAPATVVIYLLAVEGLRYLWQQPGHCIERSFVIAVCFTVAVASLSRQTGSSVVNTRFVVPNIHKLVAQRLADVPGKHLVLVSYDLQHHYPGNELVHNGAVFDTEKILWARSKGPGGDLDLCRAYSDRSFWTVTTDDTNFTLTPDELCSTARDAKK